MTEPRRKICKNCKYHGEARCYFDNGNLDAVHGWCCLSDEIVRLYDNCYSWEGKDEDEQPI